MPDQTLTPDPKASEQSTPALASQGAVSEPSKTDAPAAGAKVESVAAVKVERPADLDEAYWDAEKGAPNLDKLLPDLKELRAFKARRESELAQVPETLDGYKAELPEAVAKKLPEGMQVEFNPDDPRLPMAREFARRHGLSAEGFKELVGLQVEAELAMESFMKERVDESRKALGTKAQQRVDAVTQFVQAKTTPARANAILQQAFTAEFIEGIEDLMRSGQPGPGAGGRDARGAPSEISDEDYERMTPQERLDYARKHSKPQATRKTAA